MSDEQERELRELSERELREIDLNATCEAVKAARRRIKAGPIQPEENTLW